MRPIIALAALLTASLFALPVQAQDPCNNGADTAVVDISTSDCQARLVAFDDFTCVGDWGNSLQASVAGHSATVYHCLGFASYTVPHQPRDQFCQHGNCPIEVDTFAACPGLKGQFTHPLTGPVNANLRICEPNPADLPA